MQCDSTQMMFTRQFQLLLATREEDFKELSKKIAEVQRQHNSKVETLTERVVQLERRIAGVESASRF
jgi:hypothetical protein